MKYVTLDGDLFQVFALLPLRDLGPCYALRDKVSMQASDALSDENAGALQGLLRELVAVHRAGIGLALANDLPTFGIAATAHEWFRQLGLVRVKSPIAELLAEFREPAAWDLYRFPEHDVAATLLQAFIMSYEAGGTADPEIVFQRLKGLGLHGPARVVRASLPQKPVLAVGEPDLPAAILHDRDRFASSGITIKSGR